MNLPIPLMIATLALPAFTASAVDVVYWGGSSEIVTSSRATQNANSGTTLVLDMGYTSPDVGPNYYPDSTDRTPNFFGSSDLRLQIRNSGLDNIGANGNGVASSDSIVLWTNAEFLNGGDSNAATLTGMSAITGDNASGVTTTSRFVIRLGSTFYVSDPVVEGTATVSDPTRLTWNHYDPQTDFTTIGSPVALSDFSNLTAAGLYFTSTLDSPGTIISELEEFTVTADIAAGP